MNNARWLAWRKAFAARTRRERAAVVLLAVVGLPAGLLLGWVEPGWRETQAHQHRAETLQARLRAPQPPLDANELARRELATLLGALPGRENDVETLSRTLVGPAQMQAVVEALVRRTPGVRLLALRSMPVEPWQPGPGPEAAPLPVGSAAAAPAVGATTSALFRHGLDVEVEGGWEALQRWLGTLERSERPLLWGQAELKADQYPRIVLKLRLHTLSLEATWMRL